MSKANKLLVSAIRQYRHNNKPEFINGYDIAEVDKVVEQLQAENKITLSSVSSLKQQIRKLNNHANTLFGNL